MTVHVVRCGCLAEIPETRKSSRGTHNISVIYSPLSISSSSLLPMDTYAAPKETTLPFLAAPPSLPAILYVHPDAIPDRALTPPAAEVVDALSY